MPKSTMMIHEGRFAAELEYEESAAPSSFGSTVSVESAEKLDRVRLALRRGDIAAASKEAKVFELRPIAAE